MSEPDTLSPPAPADAAAPWRPENAAALYHVDAWGESYFHVNAEGHVAVRPLLDSEQSIDLHEVAEALAAQGVHFPVLIRVQDLLSTRVIQLNTAFRTAMDEVGYQGRYTGLYPVKVNQLREVVEEVLDAGKPFGGGLECGSKAELVATLPYLTDDTTLLVCNGYKDVAMLRLILQMQRLGKTVLPVVEKFGEFERLRQLALDLAVEPRLGVRVRLATVGAGQWAGSSGDRSKFGVPMPELLTLVERLEADGQRDALQLLHFHLGSQVANVQVLKNAVKEITRIYVSLVQRGFAVQYLDVGGGLGVNYDAMPLGGGRGGVDYSMQEYANAIVYGVQEVCATEGVPPPTIVTENGRAVTAHHSVLIVEAHAATTREALADDTAPPEDAHELVRWLYGQWRQLHNDTEPYSLGQLLEVYHDVVEQRRNADTLFAFGYLPLEQKAFAERLFWSSALDLHRRLRRLQPEWLPPELAELDDLLVDQLLCNFSVFQSLIDYWGLGQLFPILPLHRLDEEPTRRATLMDLTCDSDGTVNRFVSPNAEKRALEVHPLREGEPYRLGVFLMGAYQDILGDDHNLFGGVTEAHIYVDVSQPGGYAIENRIPGVTVEEMLARVQYFPGALQQRMHMLLKHKTRTGVIRAKQAETLLDEYSAFFRLPTYLDPSAESAEP
ncbi:MAG: biosynthetic arginine decarboxylase [Rhodothermaceae bacterium]|nr:biosynthetic arginine decarboxylase [Rhodothermaceae bacterium]